MSLSDEGFAEPFDINRQATDMRSIVGENLQDFHAVLFVLAAALADKAAGLVDDAAKGCLRAVESNDTEEDDKDEVDGVIQEGEAGGSGSVHAEGGNRQRGCGVKEQPPT